MKVEVLAKNDSEVQFKLTDVSHSFANALRRVMMNEVPTMAIEWVDFKKNDSVLADELIANRLGQVPLTFDQKAYNFPEECKCEGKGCSRCQVELVLKKKGPGMLYSGDLKSKAKDVAPVFDKIPIVELFEGEEMQFEAIAQLGKGKKHVKWQGAVVGYKYDNDTFTFRVETVSGLSPEDVVIKSAEVLQEKVELFEKELKKLK